MRYKIVIYNAGKRIKVIGSSNKYKEANEIYQLNLVNNLVYFPKANLWTGRKTDYELVLLGPPEGKSVDHVIDDMGRKIYLNVSGGDVIRKIEPYYIEEEFLYKNNGTMYEFLPFVRNFVVKIPGTKVFQTVKNKLVIEYFDSERLDLFVLKNKSDAQRLSDTIKEYCYANKITRHIFFADIDRSARSRLYTMIEEKLGIDKKYMYRDGTR